MANPRPGYIDRDTIAKAARPYGKGRNVPDGGMRVVVICELAVAFWLFVAFIVVGLVVVL